MQLKFEIIEKSSGKIYDYNKFVKIIKQAINFAKSEASKGRNIEKLAVNWNDVKKLIGADVKVHTFTTDKANRTKFNKNGKIVTLKDIENEFNVRITEDRDNNRLNIKPLDL